MCLFGVGHIKVWALIYLPLILKPLLTLINGGYRYRQHSCFLSSCPPPRPSHDKTFASWPDLGKFIWNVEPFFDTSFDVPAAGRPIMPYIGK